MKIALITAGVLVAIVLLVVVIGYALPVKHTATRETVIPADTAAVFAAISTPSEFPQWRRGVKSVEMLPPVEGKQSFRENGSDGAITYVYDELVPSQRLVSRIADRSLPFGGSWTFELNPVTAGTRVRVTENGEVYNPVFRFVSRFIFGHDRTIAQYLEDLETRVTAGSTRP
jgi:uncharacterized protein YndB with AHSA1/START domain